MSTSGMARKVDELGRIVLPVEMRRLFGIQAGDAMEISVDERGIVLRKRETRCVFCGATESLRSYREKQVCSACANELLSPAEPDTAPPSGSDMLPPAPPGVAAAPAGADLLRRPDPEPQRDVVDAPPGHG